ncbi:LysR family transcriptional regulator [Colwellia demingiae]|uniref:LysR family transcriptional regulator n=1 Tax=Colwellia demingiae TaxID=89401 RepID=A0A5C6QAL2_9GAMM|nr:LysR family transcriptional regulator [Colwellia demingiae]TWX65889.1 LysR family transcriptional regulator [Colwellia demingiae]
MARYLRNVDLNLLSIFTALMHEKNISHAAENLGMTQPAVSQALKRLRSLYNDPLFERKAGKMMPTLKADEIYPIINKILADVSSTLPDTGDFLPETANLNFHINILGVGNSNYLTKLSQYLAHVAPNISLTVSTDMLIDAEKSLRDKEYDLHLDYLTIDEIGCHHQELFDDKLFVIARKEHPSLNNKTNLLLSEYLAEKHAVLAPRKGNVYPLSLAMQDFSYNREIKYTSTSIENILEIVSATDLICIMPGTVLQSMRNVDDYIWFNPPFKTKQMIAYMNWHWSMEHVKSHRWLRTIIIDICKNMQSLPAIQ